MVNLFVSKLKYILFFVFSLLLSTWISYTFFPNTQIEYREKQIDTNVWVEKAEYNHQFALLMQLRSENKKLTDDIKATGNRITSLTTANITLKLTNDALKNQLSEALRPKPIPPHQPFSHNKDTSYTFKTTFTNELFENISVVKVEKDKIYNDLSISQMRPLDIKIITTVDKNNENIIVYVTSKDFESLNIESKTSLKKKKKIPYFTLGIITGFLVAKQIR